MSVYDEYRSLNDAIASSVESLKSIEEMARSIYEMQYEVSNEACYAIGRMGEIYITAVNTESDCLKLLYPELMHPEKDGKIPEDTLKKEFEAYNAELKEKNELPVDYVGFLRHVISDIHNTYRDMMNGNDAIRSLVSQRNNLMDSVMKIRNSDEFKDRKAKQIQEIKDKIDATDDLVEKKRLQEVLDFQDTVDNMDYIMQRVNNIPAEKESIVNSFFDKSKSSYIMKRAEDRFKQMKLGTFAIIRRFFNIEETFLDDKYAPLNNLFMFSAIRMIANAKDEKLKICAKDILINMNRLFTHTFASPEMEAKFISKIAEFDDVFINDDKIVNRFKTENKSWSEFDSEQQKKHYHQYYKLDFRPCGVDSVLTSGRLYNYVTPNRVAAAALAYGIRGDIKDHYDDVDAVMFTPSQDIGGNNISGYDKFMEVANEALANKSSIASKRILILVDIASSTMDVEDYKFFLMRASLLVAATGWTVINICAMSDNSDLKFEFKSPVLSSVDKIESNTGFYALRLKPMYNSGYFTMAFDSDSESKTLSFMVLSGSEPTCTESIYHSKFDEETNKMVVVPHSIMYPDEIENAANFLNEDKEESDSAEEVPVTDEDTVEEVTKELPDNVIPMTIKTENGVEEVPGMFIQKEGTVEIPDEDESDLKVDVVTKSDAEN